MANSYMFDDIPLYLAIHFSVEHSTLERSIILKYVCAQRNEMKEISMSS